MNLIAWNHSLCLSSFSVIFLLALSNLVYLYLIILCPWDFCGSWRWLQIWWILALDIIHRGFRSQSKYHDKGKGIVYVLRIIPPHSYSRAGKLCRPLGNEILAYCLRFFFLNKWEIIWTSLSRCLFTQETHLDCGKITSNGHKDSATLMWNFCSTSYTSVQLVKHRGSCRYFVLEGSWSLQCMTLKSLEHDSASLSSVTLTFMLQATWRAYTEKEYEKVDRNLPISLIVRNNRHICRKSGRYMVIHLSWHKSK